MYKLVSGGVTPFQRPTRDGEFNTSLLSLGIWERGRRSRINITDAIYLI